jgi:hypothetical protein
MQDRTLYTPSKIVTCNVAEHCVATDDRVHTPLLPTLALSLLLSRELLLSPWLLTSSHPYEIQTAREYNTTPARPTDRPESQRLFGSSAILRLRINCVLSGATRDQNTYCDAFGVCNPFPSRLSYTSVLCSGSSDTTLSRPGFHDKELMMDTWI